MRNKSSSSLTEKEFSFCCHFVNTGNIKESAIHAGYISNPQKSGEKLLANPKICQQINNLYKEKKDSLTYRAYTGYERLAFGNISDAIKLLFCSEIDTDALNGMDLFNISEIRRPKDGAMEIKFFDRLRALEKLEQAGVVKNESVPFYQVLEKSISSLNDNKESLWEE